MHPQASSRYKHKRLVTNRATPTRRAGERP